MKIAIFTDTFFPATDGVVTVITNIAKSFANKGHKIYIIAPKYTKRENFFYPNVKIFRIKSASAPFYPDYKLSNFLNLSVLKYLKKQKIDIVHVHSPASIGVFGLIVAKYLKIPLIGTFHTLLGHPGYLKHIMINNEFVQNISWGLQRFFYDKCDLVTCPSESAKEELVNHGFKKPIKVISNGIDFSEWNPKNLENVNRDLNLKGDVLLFIGRIAHEKNLLYLLECFKLVLEKKKKVKLLIVGDGPQMKELKEDIKKLDLSGNIVLTGKIEHSHLADSGIFKIGKLFITCSNTETQGITILESQINGLVCVGLDATGTKDLIKNNYNGFLIKEGNKKEFAKKIIELLDNRKLRLRMKKNTLKEIKKHDFKKIINIWKEVYTRLIHG